MNRSDGRIVVVVLVTAIASAAVTALVTQRLATGSSTDDRLLKLERRIEVLEVLREQDVVSERMKRLVTDAPPTPPQPPSIVPDPIVVPPDPTPCDEVACVLSNYQPACCAAYNHAAVPEPEGLTRGQISDGINAVKAKIYACGDKSSAKGRVSVSVRVAPDGSIAHVAINATPDAALGSCVEQAVSHAKFAATHDGGSFRYPFIF